MSEYSRKKTLRAFPQAYTILAEAGGQLQARWRSDGRIERYILSQIGSPDLSRNKEASDKFEALLRKEQEYCKTILLHVWNTEISDARLLSELCRKRRNMRPDLAVVFRSEFNLAANETRLGDSERWRLEAEKIENFVEFVEYTQEYYFRVRSWTDEMRTLVKDFDKTEGDYTRRNLTVWGFWISVASIIISSLFSIAVDILGLSR